MPQGRGLVARSKAFQSLRLIHVGVNRPAFVGHGLALIGLLEGLGHGAVVLGDEGEYLLHQIVGGGEDVSLEVFAGQDAAPNLDLVHRRGRDRNAPNVILFAPSDQIRRGGQVGVRDLDQFHLGQFSGAKTRFPCAVHSGVSCIERTDAARLVVEGRVVSRRQPIADQVEFKVPAVSQATVHNSSRGDLIGKFLVSPLADRPPVCGQRFAVHGHDVVSGPTVSPRPDLASGMSLRRRSAVVPQPHGSQLEPVCNRIFGPTKRQTRAG